MLPGLSAQGASDIHARSTLREIIHGLGLNTGLKLCLDAGDSASYPGSGTTWRDTSGGGYDFIPSPTAPGTRTFTGVAGRQSSSEYFACSTGQFGNFEYDSANETWMNNLHKNNAKLTIIAVHFVLSGAGNVAATLVSTTAISASPTGFNFENNPTSHPTAPEELAFLVENAGTIQYINSGLTPSKNTWLFQAASIDEGAGTAVFRLNGSTASKTGTFTGPSSSNASDRLNIHLEEGRVAAVAIWEGVALSAANITSIYDVIRSKYGL